jgi:vacuolar protein sorting-associated protein 72
MTLLSFLKASQPKKAKVESRNYTQGELIALALDTEEGNIVEHRDYLKNEAEKRKRARVMRTAVSGPLIRWISRKEEVKVVVPPPPPPSPSVVPQAPVPSIYRSIYGPPGSLFTPTTYSYSSGTAVVTTVASTSTQETQFKVTTPATAAQKTPYSAFQHYLDTASSPFPMWPPATTGQQQSYYPNISQPAAQQQAPATSSVQQAVNTITSAPPEPQYRLETVAKNYVVHELAQQKGTPKPTWTQSMQSMFGDHVKWDEIKVYVGKNRPLCKYSTPFFALLH